MNSVQLLGNLVRDPDVRSTKTGKTVTRFTVACSRYYTASDTGEQKEMTDFIPCVAWGTLAESCGNNLAKGTRVFVQGRITTRSYETQDGQKRYVTEVNCDFVGSPLGRGNGGVASSPAGGDNFGAMGNSAKDTDIPF